MSILHISKTGFLIFAILVAATYLRMSHVHFGMPERYHPDERFAAKLVRNCLNGDCKIERFNHPPLLKNTAFVGAKIFGMFKPVQDGRYYLRALKSLRHVSLFYGIAAVLFFISPCPGVF